MRMAPTVAGWFAAVLAFGGFGSPAAAATGASPQAASSGLLFRFSDARIAESSGLAVSSVDDSVYTHNDSGDSAQFFRVSASGATVAVYTLHGATNVDWEDMASGTATGEQPVLYFGDIGDNSRNRKEIDVYEVPEPKGPSADVAWVRYRFTYPDGPHDAEALLVDPRSHRVYIATKVLFGDGELYEAPEALSRTALNPLTPVRSVPALTTSGAFSPDGTRIGLLTYLGAYWADDVRGTFHAFEVPRQPQAEAIAFTGDGSSVLVGSEGLHSAVYRVSLPAAGSAPPSRRPPSRPAPSISAAPSQAAPSQAAPQAATVGSHHRLGPVLLAVPVVVVLAGLGAAVIRRRRRS